MYAHPPVNICAPTRLTKVDDKIPLLHEKVMVVLFQLRFTQMVDMCFKYDDIADALAMMQEVETRVCTKTLEPFPREERTQERT